jgi:hypothetical protein
VPSEIIHHPVKAHHFSEPVKQGSGQAPENQDEFYDKRHFQIGTFFYDCLNDFSANPVRIQPGTEQQRL